MIMYKLVKDLSGNVNFVQRLSDAAFIPFDVDNTDYQAFLKYQAEGGVVLPADDNEQTA
jgi:hypothetical protein